RAPRASPLFPYTTLFRSIYAASVAGWPNSYSPGAGLWTERELWVALKAAIRYHDISGDAAALARAQSQVDQWDQVAAGRKAPLRSEEHTSELQSRENLVC